MMIDVSPILKVLFHTPPYMWGLGSGPKLGMPAGLYCPEPRANQANLLHSLVTRGKVQEANMSQTVWHRRFPAGFGVEKALAATRTPGPPEPIVFRPGEGVRRFAGGIRWNASRRDRLTVRIRKTSATSAPSWPPLPPMTPGSWATCFTPACACWPPSGPP